MFSKQSREPLALLAVQSLQSTPVKEKQGTTYMIHIMGTTQTKEMYSELLKPNKLIYQSVAKSYSNTTCSLSDRRFDIPSKSESVVYILLLQFFIQILSALIWQMLNFQSDCVFSMEKMDLVNCFCVTIGHMSWKSCWHAYWEGSIDSDSTHPVKHTSYIELHKTECWTDVFKAV